MAVRDPYLLTCPHEGHSSPGPPKTSVSWVEGTGLPQSPRSPVPLGELFLWMRGYSDWEYPEGTPWLLGPAGTATEMSEGEARTLGKGREWERNHLS